MVNQSSVTKFILLGFSNLQKLQILHVVVFLTIYILALIGNCLTIQTVIHNHHLHSPMYFFLVNLSCIDVMSISTVVPRSLLADKSISYSGCVIQVFFVLVFPSTEVALLTVMAYDRYVAICYPLQYSLIMNWNACFKMAATSFLCGVTNAVVLATNVFSLHFCSSHVEQFSVLLKISCSDTQPITWYLLATAIIVGFCFLFVMVSYTYIFSTVLKNPSAQVRYKAFSTCTPHLAVYCLFLITGTFSYLRPNSLSSPTVGLLSAVLYMVIPPLMNPIIYSLRNREIQMAVSITLHEKLRFFLSEKMKD